MEFIRKGALPENILLFILNVKYFNKYAWLSNKTKKKEKNTRSEMVFNRGFLLADGVLVSSRATEEVFEAAEPGECSA